MHIFCCCIPLLATIIGLGTNIGFVSNAVSENFVLSNFENFEVEILLLSGVILLLAFILKLRAKKMKCCSKTAKNFCDKNEKINNLFLKISSVLYLFSLSTLVITKFL